MRIFLYKIVAIIVILQLASCKNVEESSISSQKPGTNQIQYATSLSIYKQEGYSIVKVNNPWPNANKKFTYILKEKNGIVPDSLKQYTLIAVPLPSIVVTSTTNIPFLEMLEVESKLLGFPHTDYVSSGKTRKLIDAGKVKNIGQNERLNVEQLIDLNPAAIITFGIDNNNPMIDNLQKSGLKVLIQADWMEQSPLGKAEWIKLYGALFGKEKEAEKLFNAVVENYKEATLLVADKKPEATVLYGSMYQDHWYVANGSSWVAKFMKDAKSNYLWADTKGSGSTPLSFEQILEKGKLANYWITTGSFASYPEMKNSNPHYSQFDAFTKKNIYSFESKLGATGGTIYYELAPSRPDLVLKDFIKIFHPEVLPNYSFTFAEKLK
ncbi:MAG: iron complex transport system substrate-binding protein [Flavobacteriales bacterium]|jgi:iron complex transport system substrate-binding protein